MPYMILIPVHGLDKLISHLGVCHYITKTHLGGQDTLQVASITRFQLSGNPSNAGDGIFSDVFSNCRNYNEYGR
jgi:hypothetical protein